jgi:hypothetical protein
MVTPLNIAFVEWPEDLSTGDPQWIELSDSVTAVHPDILVTNELPFGPWLACSPVIAGAMASLVSRAYVVSSNRMGRALIRAMSLNWNEKSRILL